MFKKTSRQQSLLESQWLLPLEKRERLLDSWAQVFRAEILPLIDEEAFRPFFEANNGQPNKSIRLLVAVHLLKERFDLTDDQVIENLEFNLAWQHALAVDPSSAHVCQKTLHNFRTLVVEEKLGDSLFVNTTKEIAKAAGISFARQRQDSTHVVSNMALLSRLGILVETISVFLKELRRELPKEFAALPAKYAERYLEREGYFADAKKEQARRRLPVVAQDLFRLVERFKADEAASALPSFGLMQRVLGEQCKIVEQVEPGGPVGVVDEAPCEPPEPAVEPGSAAVAEASPEPKPEMDVAMRDPKEISSASLQSPHDPDATYGHKGKGYETQLTETCGEENPFQLITSVAINGAHESDQHALLPTLDGLAKNGMAPETMIADTGFGSGENIVGAAQRGVSLLARVQDPNKGGSSDTRWERPIEPPAGEQAAPALDKPAAPAQDVVGAAPEGSTPERALDLADFKYSPDFRKVESCPAGRTPCEQAIDRDRVNARFEAATCKDCPLAANCPARRLKDGGRKFGYRPAEAATSYRQKEQRTQAFKEAYRIRSGIESTNSQLKGMEGADDLRVRGRKRVALAMTLKSLSLNVFRYVRHVTEKLEEAASSNSDLATAEG